MEPATGIFALIIGAAIIALAIALLVAPFKLYSIHSELRAIRKLLEAEVQRDARDRWASTHPPAA